MIITALIIAGAILSVVAVIVFFLNLTRAPEGLEDETGFHELQEPATPRNHYYCARSKPILPARTAKPLKVEIPAA